MNVCLECDKAFEGDVKAKYCSVKCRQKAYRKRIKKLVEAARGYDNNLKDADKWTKAPSNTTIEKPKSSKPDDINSYWKQRFNKKLK